MPFAENLAPFFADFGDDALLDGVGVRGNFDDEGVLEGSDGVLTRAPMFELPSSAIVGVTSASMLVIPGTASFAGTYAVRQAVPRPPDGVIAHLVLARA